jgi:hypothetical protein
LLLVLLEFHLDSTVDWLVTIHQMRFIEGFELVVFEREIQLIAKVTSLYFVELAELAFVDG